jgi:hypothetical protein
VFTLEIGGSAGNASYAVSDLRKLCGFEAYTPTDKVSELTARANDEGWDTTLAEWLRGSRLRADYGVLVFPPGGGSERRAVKVNLVRAFWLVRNVGASILGIVGCDDGFTAELLSPVALSPSFSLTGSRRMPRGWRPSCGPTAEPSRPGDLIDEMGVPSSERTRTTWPLGRRALLRGRVTGPPHGSRVLRFWPGADSMTVQVGLHTQVHRTAGSLSGA